jgi:DNA polymerase I-like protein with 3'-5' exonuclease and polymerase domains
VIQPAANCGYLRSLGELEYLASKCLADGSAIAVDVETGYDGQARQYSQSGPSTHPEEAFITGFSFTNSPAWARYAPIRHDDGPNLPIRAATKELWRLARSGLLVPHGVTMEPRFMSRLFAGQLADDPEYGSEVRATLGYFPLLSDTMVEAYELAQWESVALKYLSRAVFGYEQTELHELFPGLPQNKRKSLRFNTLDPTRPEVFNYACDDVVQGLRLHLRNYPLVKGKLLYQVGMALIPILCQMEDDGIVYDWEMMRSGAAEGKAFLARLQAEIQDMLTERLGRAVQLNLGSAKQLGAVLYGTPEDGGLGLRTSVLTKGDKEGNNKKMSTGKLALKSLAEAEPVVARILDWKKLKRLVSVYLDKYPKDYNYASDGRAHVGWKSCWVVSGRFAAADPPVQQSPKKYHFELADGTAFDFNFRDVITVPPGWYLLGFDYSQIELRVIAGEAQEPALLESFAAGEDVHSKTASLLLGMSMEQVAAEGVRPVGKTMNFALVYQLGIKGLAERLSGELKRAVSVAEAEQLYNQYFTIYSKIGAYTRRLVADAQLNGYTMSRLGRRHPIWEYKSDMHWVRSKGDRLAGNAPVQGGAADYVRIAMVKAQKALVAAGLADRVRLVMNVHDALEFYVRGDVSARLVIDVLEPAVIFPIDGWPAMKADWHIGTRWGSIHEIKRMPDGSLRAEGVVDVGMQEDDEDEDDSSDSLPRPAAAPVPPRSSCTGCSHKAHPEPCKVLGKVECRALPGGGSMRGRFPCGCAVGVPVPPPAPEPVPDLGGTLVVTTATMPDAEAFLRFRELVDAAPGRHSLVMRTPQGEVPLPLTTSLSPQQEAQISLALGGATVTWAPGSESLTSGLASGLTL